MLRLHRLLRLTTRGLNPLECNSHEYMKYVFTSQFADLAGGRAKPLMKGMGKSEYFDLYLLENWGHHGNADLNSDQIVNATDMILLLNNWTGPAFSTGACCINEVCSIRSQPADTEAGTYYLRQLDIAILCCALLVPTRILWRDAQEPHEAMIKTPSVMHSSLGMPVSHAATRCY